MLRRVDWQVDALISMIRNTVNLSVKHSKGLSSTVSVYEGDSLHGVISLQIRIVMFVHFVALWVFVLHVCKISVYKNVLQINNNLISPQLIRDIQSLRKSKT